jgi:DNA repair protein RecO (recombination protein O)
MPSAHSYSSAGFILHSYPYKETSLILETFTRTYGRVAMIAKGAKRNGMGKYAVNPFQPVQLDWFGRAELKTMKSSSHERVLPQLRGRALMAAFYVNELILKLAVKDDPHEGLFDVYAEAVEALVLRAPADRGIEVVLRLFELAMLAELGYALTLTHEADSTAEIRADQQYWYVVDRGPVLAEANRKIAALDPVLLSGRTLIALASKNLDAETDATILSQAKQLMRRVLNHHLGDKSLHTRQLMREMKN